MKPIRQNLFAFSGSASRPSKTRSLLETVVERLARHTDVGVRVEDCGSFMNEPLTYDRNQLSERAAAVVDGIEQADLLVVGSPVYKGSYSGLFKHVFDLVDPRTLHNKPVLICATGGGHRHALVVEHQLRPLFSFFCARTAPVAIYAGDSDFRDGAVAATDLSDRIDQAVKDFAMMARQPLLQLAS